MSQEDTAPFRSDGRGDEETTEHVSSGNTKTDTESKALSEVKLSELSDQIKKAASNAGWPELTKVQSLAIPYMLSDTDVMVQSHTGSGKTGAFILPMLEKLDPKVKATQALVLVPTRELAVQVSNEAKTLFEGHELDSVAVYGGVSYKPQISAFKEGVQLVIGTPGRILDHLMNKNLRLDKLRLLVLDEADRMLSMGFYPDMLKLKKFLPETNRSSYMFSATYPSKVITISRLFLDNPEMLSLSKGQVHAMLTSHSYYRIPSMQKDRWMVKLIEIENPQNAIIFCNTKAKVHYVSSVLQRFGYDADELSAELSQSKREKVLEKIKKGNLRFLVATDIAARGIDISELSHVFHYEPPEDPEAYIHRSGRTGRAGASGKVITLTEGFEPIELKKIAKKYKIDLEECQLPEEQEIEKIIGQRAVAMLDSDLRQRDNLHKERMQKFVSLVKDLSSSEDEIQLLAMILDDYYHTQLHGNTVFEEEQKTEKKALKSDKKKKKSRRKNNKRSEQKDKTDQS